MTYGLARAATSDELILFDTPGKKSRYYAAIKQPRTVFTCLVNQTITSWDGLQSVIFDGGSGTRGQVLPDMTMLVGTVAGGRDVAVLRVRSTDSTHIYFDQYSGAKIMDNQYITIIDDFKLLQRHIKIDGDTVLMDGTEAYSDQHSKPDPVPIMGGHRVVELTATSVNVSFDFSQSYVIDGSAIASYQVIAPTASFIAFGTTSHPTLTYINCGWHNVYCNITAENGKTFFGVRYVYVWNKDHLPPRVKIANPASSVSAGGWSFEVETYRDVSSVHKGDFAILFSVDWWGDTEESIGPVAGSENIEAVGWIASPESIAQNPEHGSVHFTVEGPHYWMGKISSYPDGVQFKISEPTAWTEMQNLTVDKGVWHFLHWRTTATRILDFFPSGDIRMTGEVSSLAENLWSQLQEMTALQILARPGFNAQGQLFIQINPNLIPTGSRSFATVMDIDKPDWIDELDFDRITLDEVCQVNMSGVALDAGGNGLAYFANAPGHTYNHYGTPDILDKLLLSSQDEVITLAGLYFTWRNNQLPVIPINLKANNRLIDIFPNSKCTTTILASDNVRGLGYSGGLYPETISVNFDDETGRATRTVEFRTETHESLAVKESVPGSGDMSTLPPFSFPPLPVFSGGGISGGVPPSSVEGPRKFIIHDVGVGQKGLLYTPSFNLGAGSEWYQVNGGLTTAQYQNVSRIVVTPSGAVYVAAMVNPTPGDSFLAYAPYAGAPFTIIEDHASMVIKAGHDDNTGLAYLACNPLSGEVVYCIVYGGEGLSTYIGTGVTFTAKTTADINVGIAGGSLSYGLGAWLATGGGTFLKFATDMGSVVGSGSVGTFYQNARHCRASTTGKTIHWSNGDGTISLGANNCGTVTNTISSNIDNGLFSHEQGIACDATGLIVLGRLNTGTPIRSADGGYTWTGFAGVPPTGIPPLAQNVYVPIQGTEFVAVAGEPYYTPDGGVHWTSHRGNLTTVCPLLECNAAALVGI